MREGKKIVSKEPWQDQPPQAGQTEAELNWGYLVFHEDRSFEFLNERPSDAELQARSSCLLPTPGTGEERDAPKTPKRNGPRQKQAGFSLVQMVLAIGLMSYMTIQLIPYVSAWQENQLIRVTRLGIEQIAQAAVAFRAAQEDHFSTAVWPADLLILVTDGHLPGPVTRYKNSVGNDYKLNMAPSPGRWLELSTEMLTVQQARKVAADWGAFARVSGAVVTVNIAIPGQESSHGELVQLDGSHQGQQQVMRGPLHWNTALTELDAGGNPIPTTVAIDLGGNEIAPMQNLDVQNLAVQSRLRVEGPGGPADPPAILEADIGNIQALTATEFSYDQ